MNDTPHTNKQPVVVSSARDLALLIRSVRLQQSLTQGALATRVGVTRQAIANLESGRTTPSITTAIAALQALTLHIEVSSTEPAAGTRTLVRVIEDWAGVQDSAVFARPGPLDLDAVLAAVRSQGE